jgi:hypothetical protein
MNPAQRPATKEAPMRSSGTATRYATRLLSAVLFAAAGCSSPSPADGQGSGDRADSADRTLKVVISVDWEGRELVGLDDMKKFRDDHPNVPLTQYLNAAYFTKKGADAEEVATKIKSVLRPGDEHGLHIHAWKSLFEAAGVTYHNGTTYWGRDSSLEDCTVDCGQEVMLNSYSTEEIQRVIKFSNDTLVSHGFTRPVSFRAGGFIADRAVLEAVTAEGFVRDSSPIQAAIFEADAKGYLEILDPNGSDDMLHWAANERMLWPFKDSQSQPRRASFSHGSLLEIPFNGTMVDYHAITNPATFFGWAGAPPDDLPTMESMLAVYHACRALVSADSETVMTFGFHQESAPDYLAALGHFLQLLDKEAKGDKVTIKYVTTADIAGPKAP